MDKIYNMNLLDVMLKRRSVRIFSDEKISNESLNKILQAGLLAPSSMNRKPCEFLVVENKNSLEKLSKAKDKGASFLADCDKAIVVAANSLVADTWIEDSSIALSYMNLMATSLDVGSCWVQIHLRKSDENRDSEDIVREILGIDEYYRIVGILALGISDSELKPHSILDIDKRKIHFHIK